MELGPKSAVGKANRVLRAVASWGAGARPLGQLPGIPLAMQEGGPCVFIIFLGGGVGE